MDSEQLVDVDLKRYAGVLWRWLWLLVLVGALAGGGAYLASSSGAPMYEASSTLLVNEEQLLSGPDYNSMIMSQQMALTYSMMMTETPVLAEVTARLKVAIAEEALREMITVEAIPDTLLIKVTTRGPDPQLAANVANAVPQVFIEQHQKAESARYASSLASLDGAIEQMQAQVQATQQALDAERLRAVPNSPELARLEALVAQYRSAYASLLQDSEALRVADARGSHTVTITRPATLPTQPIVPGKALNALLAAAVGMAVAAGAALLFDYLGDTIEGEGDVQKVVGLPMLAAIRRFTRAESDKGLPLMVAYPESDVAEAYRSLRANVQFAALGTSRPVTTIVVSSAELQEGKTTTVANLGISLAQTGKKVLIVDANLRRPTLHTWFGLSNDTGLTSFFVQQMPVAEAIIKGTSVNGLRVLTAGPVAANPAELLGCTEFAATLEHLKGLADYLILDSPAVLGVADAGVLSLQADAVLLVAQPGKTRRNALKDSVLILQKTKVRLLGVVLNKAGRHVRRQYRYYSHHQGRSEHTAR